MSETAKAAGERGIRPPSASGNAASGASDRTVSGPRIRAVKSKIDAVVLVCTKCQKRQGMPKRTVRDLLKRGLKRGHPKRKLRIVETGCLGPCPKRALAVANRHRVPFLGVRSVSDGKGDPLNLPGFPVQFAVYRQLAGNNAAAVTVAFLRAWAAAGRPTSGGKAG